MDESLAGDSEKLQKLMQRFGQSFGRHRMNSLAQGKINVPQFHTMHALLDMGEASMGELSERMGVTMGASTNIVDKLVRSGYASRRRDPKDRRIVKVQLTDDGKQTVNQVTEDCREFLARVLGDIDPDERSRFARTYERMVELSEREVSTNAD